MKWRAALEIAAYVAVMAGVIVLVAGCSGPAVYRDRVVTVKEPVTQPCAGERPNAVPQLRTFYDDAAWQAMDARQKAAAVSKQALDLRTWGEQLDAATAGCE